MEKEFHDPTYLSVLINIPVVHVHLRVDAQEAKLSWFLSPGPDPGLSSTPARVKASVIRWVQTHVPH